MDLSVWKDKNKEGRHYAHFDKRVSLEDVWNYISDPEKIAKHGFYPFIHYTLSFKKYSKKEGIKLKTREICYSAHLDRYIYKYYSYLLNQKYNEKVKLENIEGVPIAYRDNLNKSNIHFAKRAFDFIKETKECFIIIGDFTNFFDRLDHKYLKNMLCYLLGEKILPPDIYAVYKNVTKYAVWDLDSLLSLNGLEKSKKGIREFNNLETALPFRKFKELKSKYVIKNNKSFGIPQGSPISAVLSNIYMLAFDKKISDFVKMRQGLYMRYSDDFIVIFPHNSFEESKNNYQYIITQINDVPGLILEPEKTQFFFYKEGLLKNCSDKIVEGFTEGKDILNYLGFAFDGQKISIRDKTITKYYYRLYRKIKTIVKNKGITKYGNRISKKNLYEKYTIKGAHIGKGNFLTYVKRAEKVFNNERGVGQIKRRHLVKIKRRLNKI